MWIKRSDKTDIIKHFDIASLVIHDQTIDTAGGKHLTNIGKHAHTRK